MVLFRHAHSHMRGACSCRDSQRAHSWRSHRCTRECFFKKQRSTRRDCPSVVPHLHCAQSHTGLKASFRAISPSPFMQKMSCEFELQRGLLNGKVSGISWRYCAFPKLASAQSPYSSPSRAKTSSSYSRLAMSTLFASEFFSVIRIKL